MTLKRSWMPRAKTPLRRYTELRRSAAATAAGVEGSAGGGATVGRPPRPRTVAGHRLPVAVTKVVFDRSGGWCEIGLPGCGVHAVQSHHRITQKSGGRHGAAAARSDRCSNLLHSCVSCHETVTRSPAYSRRFEHGWSLLEHEEPSQIPVLYRDQLVYLDDVGGVIAYETAGA